MYENQSLYILSEVSVNLELSKKLRYYSFRIVSRIQKKDLENTKGKSEIK